MTAPTERCPVTELLRDGCAHCRPAPTPPAPDGDGDIVAEFWAQYDGVCSDCGGDFQAGEKIGKVRGGGYVCPGCLE